MAHVIWSPCFLSLLFLCFLTCSIARPITLHDKNASGLGLHVPHKVIQMLAKTSTSRQNKVEERKLKMIGNGKVLKQARQKSEESPEKAVPKDNMTSKCESINFAKLSRSEERRGRKVRKLLPRQRDVDAFVAYADYRGPQRHPPKNN